MSEDVSRGNGKDVTLFQKGQIIGLHEEHKPTKGIAVANWKNASIC